MFPPPTTQPSPGQELGVLFDRHHLGVWRYLRSLGCTPDLADDLTQDTFVQALGSYEDRGSVKAGRFLRSIARFLFLRTRRRLSRRREALIADEVDRIWQSECRDDSGEEWLAAVRSCVDALERTSKRAVIMEFFEGHSRPEIAAALDLKPNGLKTLMQRTRARLRECVKRRLGAAT